MARLVPLPVVALLVAAGCRTETGEPTATVPPARTIAAVEPAPAPVPAPTGGT